MCKSTLLLGILALLCLASLMPAQTNQVTFPDRQVWDIPGRCTFPETIVSLQTGRRLHCNQSGSFVVDADNSGGGSTVPTDTTVAASSTVALSCPAGEPSHTFRVTVNVTVTDQTVSCSVPFTLVLTGDGTHTWAYGASMIGGDPLDIASGNTASQDWIGTGSAATSKTKAKYSATATLIIGGTQSDPCGTVAAGTGCAWFDTSKALKYKNEDQAVTTLGSSSGSAITSGTIAAMSGTCTAGNLYLPTNSLYTQILCGASNALTYFYDGQAVVPTTLSGWTFENQGGTNSKNASISTSNGYASIRFQGGANVGADATLLSLAEPATPFTRTFTLRPNITSGITGIGPQRYFIGFESASGQLVVFLVDTALDSYHVTYGVYSASALTTGFTSPTAVKSQATPAGSAFYTGTVRIRIGDDGTNLSFAISFDGQNYLSFYSPSRTAGLTGGPTKIVIGGQNADVGGYLGDFWINVVGLQ